MRAHANNYASRIPESNSRPEENRRRSSNYILLLTTLAMVLAIVGLSSCAGYTSAAKTSPGSGGAGVLSPSSTTLSFGSVAVGNTTTQSLTVTNTGTSTVTISQATLTGAGFSVIGGNPSGTIAVGQSSTIQIQFAPTAAGAITGSLTVVSDASNSPVMISLSGTGTQTGLAIAPLALTFGNVVVGQTGSQNVELTNTGTTNIVINLATVAGNGFGISGLSLPKTLTGGQSLSFSVQFAPTAAGAATGSITFTDNAPTSPQTVTLVGSGVSTTSTLTANPGSVAFGNVSVGSNGQQTITLTNSGNTSATISAVSATGSGFTALGLSAPLTLAASQSTSFTAQFAPTASGAASGSITVTSNANDPTITIPLTGTGVQGSLAANPSTINFGSLLIGASGSVNVTLTNSGSASITISQGSASGSGFSMSGLSVPATLGAGQTATFAAKFSPTAAGSVTGSISIVSTAPGSPLTIALTGSGTAGQPQLTVSPASVSYGNVSVGSSAPQTITLTNAGNATLTVTQLTASGAAYGVSGAAMPLNIGAGSNASFTATFAPTAAGAAAGSISIVSNAPGSPASVALSGTGIQGQLGAAPSTVNFGSVNVGSNGSQTITLTNSGTASLTISQATASGTGFSISGITTPLTLGAGLSTSFTAKFAPTSAGSVSGSVSIVNNGPNSPITVSLSGSGTATAPQLTISPANVSYGNVAVGGSTPQTITLTNSGNATLTVTQATVSGTGFSMSGATMPMNINAGSNASFTATFAPTSAGAASGSISVVSNAPGSPAAIALSGTGIQGQLGANPTSVNFGSVGVGSTGTQTITLTNSGSASVTISQASASGTGFSIIGLTTPQTLGAGLSTSFTAQFAPTSAGSPTGSISIVSNAPGSPLTIPLSGTATQPQLSATPSSAAFGNVVTGTNNSQTINLTNGGSASVTISAVTVAGAGFSTSGITTPLSLAAGKSATFNAVFAPTSAGAVSGSVSLTSNAPNSPLAIALSGTGVAATKLLGLSTSSLSFGNVNVGSNSALSVALTNNGNANVTISNVSVTGAGFSQSGVTANEVLTPNQSVTVTVTFAPGTAGAVSGSVSIASDATNSPATINVSGTGVSTTPHSVGLNWNPSTSSVSGYNVYRGTTPNGPYPTKLNPSLLTTEQYSDSSVVSGETYYYVVTAVDSNNVESVDSNQATAIIP
jgi:Abnormal spindle-like microcephaly-assoc'd, ASPM-SPD-2-Hydin